MLSSNIDLDFHCSWTFCGRRVDSLKRLAWVGGNHFQYLSDPRASRPGAGEALVRMAAVGICGTDIHIIEGEFDLARPPRVLGHEIAGVVIEVGEGVQRVKAGDRVTIDQVLGCGKCFYCSRGSTQFCQAGTELGITADGGCQEHLIVPEGNLFTIPPHISDEEAAILDMEVWGALSKCGVNHGEDVLIVGPGSAGLIACQIARILGARRVFLVGREGYRMKKAQELGLADDYFFTGGESLPTRVHARTDGLGVHVAMDCAGTDEAFLTALESLMAGGRLVLYGVHRRPLSALDLNLIVLRDLVVYGALSDRRGWEKVIDLAASGALRLAPLITHRFSFEDAPAAFETVRNRPDGLIKAVITMNSAKADQVSDPAAIAELT